MITTIQITQLIFNINTQKWELHLHIRGCNTIVKISSNEASSILNSIRQEQSELDRYSVEVDKNKGLVYYIINS
jgi:hypothetical protein